MTSLLRGVVQRGTAGSACKLGWPLGGKTGTTDDYGDAWFIGFDPDITVGVWVGHDERKPIGHNETGGVAALPIWIDFMRAYIETRDPKNPPEFIPPGNIVFLPVNASSGARQRTARPASTKRSSPAPSRAQRFPTEGLNAKTLRRKISFSEHISLRLSVSALDWQSIRRRPPSAGPMFQRPSASNTP